MRYVFNVDLKDFFPSINFGRVRGFFIKNDHFNLNPNVATIIAQIACHNNELPQGSPCSPIISNLLGHLLDIKMVNLAKNSKCTYSRYADDLTFSTNNKNFPTKIAIQKEENIWTAGKLLRKEIKRLGFGLNEEKTSMQYRTARQMVTGLVVNQRVDIRREYYKKARSMCYELFKTGQFYINNKTQGKPENDKNIVGTLNQLEGILSFIYKIKRPYDPEKRQNKPSAITKLYRVFLFYRHFFLTEKPTIITEGKTDIIYLKTALRKLANQYNGFIEMSGNDAHFKIKFLNMSKNFLDVFAISTGTSGLEHLLSIYEASMRNFKGEGKNNPVIMLIDNDDGSKQIKSKQKIKPEKDLFYHITENLYLLFVSNRPNTAIEDLFDDDTRNTKVGGKIFNRLAKTDKKKEYSKIIFAKKVIVENQNIINFDGFREIFNNIEMIIDDYKKKVSD
jgi:RNA-directed DNA polymerase